MNKNAQSVIGTIIITMVIIILGYLFFWYLPHYSLGWDTGVMVGKIIGFDTAMFGTKKVFVLEDRTVFSEKGGISQSQITLCSDFDDVDIHQLVEKYLNKRVKIEYSEKRLGYYPFRYCHEAPITNISLIEEAQIK